MARKPTKQQQIETLTKQLNEAQVALRIQETAHEVQLSEARRRTIPIGPNGDKEINFLPVYITNVEIIHDIREIQTRDGSILRDFVTGAARCRIEARGDVVQVNTLTKG